MILMQFQSLISIIAIVIIKIINFNHYNGSVGGRGQSESWMRRSKPTETVNMCQQNINKYQVRKYQQISSQQIHMLTNINICQQISKCCQQISTESQQKQDVYKCFNGVQLFLWCSPTFYLFFTFTQSVISTDAVSIQLCTPSE